MHSDVKVRTGQQTAFAFNLDKALLFDPHSERRIA